MCSDSEVSPSESEDKDKTLFCLRSEFEKALVLVCLDVLVLRLETLAALDTSHGGDIMLDLMFFQENLSLFAGLKLGCSMFPRLGVC